MKKILSLIAAMIFIGSTVSFAANTQDVDMDIEIPTLLTLEWSVNGSLVQLTGANKITEAEYVAGYKDTIPGGQFNVYANTAWDLNVVADSNNFVGGSNIKPTSDLLIDLDLLNTYAFALNGLNPVQLFVNEPAVQSALHDVQYKILINTTDTAGVYSTNLTYTLVAH
jgi:hypothetical protein